MKVLIILRGISHDDKYSHGHNYKLTHENFFQRMVQPLRAQGDEVDVALSTYRTASAPKMEEVYRPVFTHMFDDSWKRHRKIDCVAEGLKLACVEAPNKYDFVIIMRFDLLLLQDITDLDIDYNKINFLWRECDSKHVGPSMWKNHKRTCDAIYMFGGRYLKAVADGFGKMKTAKKTENNCHRILNYIKCDVEKDVHFVIDGFYDSDPKRMKNPVYTEAMSNKSTKTP